MPKCGSIEYYLQYRSETLYKHSLKDALLEYIIISMSGIYENFPKIYVREGTNFEILTPLMPKSGSFERYLIY